MCDIKTRSRISIKLEQCLAEQGARAIAAFQTAFQQVLVGRIYCENPGASWTDCVKDSSGLPMKVIVVQIKEKSESDGATVPDECSAEAMESWIELKLFEHSEIIKA